MQRGISHFLIISVCLSSLLFLCHCAYDRMRFLYDSLIKQTHKQTRAFTIKSAQTFNTITELDSVKFDQKYIQCFLLLYKYYEMLLCDTQALAQPTGEKIVPIVNLQCCGLASSLMDWSDCAAKLACFSLDLFCAPRCFTLIPPVCAYVCVRAQSWIWIWLSRCVWVCLFAFTCKLERTFVG